MSARPRPVTATFKPASMAPPTGVRTRSYSLSSGSSTASLVSILDHDSYESLPESEPETQEEAKEEQPGTSGHQGEKLEAETEKGSLSPWEKWLLNKAKNERDAIQREERRKRRLKMEELKKQREKEESLKKAEEKYSEWLEKKTLQLKIKEKQVKRQEKTKKEIEEEKKEEILNKSKEKFNDWMKEKKSAEAKQRREEKEKKKKEEEEKEAKRKKCEEMFDEWCKKAQQRPKSSQSSLGYVSGKLTGYYDKGALPAPSYYNPIPWQPIHVPQPKTARTGKSGKGGKGGKGGVKRPVSAAPSHASAAAARRAWNPSKYR